MHTHGLGFVGAWDVVGLVQTGKKLEVGKATPTSKTADQQILAEKYARKWSKIAN